VKRSTLIDLSLARDDRGFERLAATLDKLDHQVTVRLELEDWEVLAVVDHPSWFAPQRVRLYQITG
jgi:hypothetical protein